MNMVGKKNFIRIISYQHFFHLLKLPGHDSDVAQFGCFVATKETGADDGQYRETQIGQVFHFGVARNVCEQFKCSLSKKRH